MASLEVEREGETGTYGPPVLRVRPPAGPLGRALRPRIGAGRAFNPRAAFVGRRAVVVFQQKAPGQASFSRAASVRGAVADAASTFIDATSTLDARRATGPGVAPLSGGRLLVLSATRTWRAVLLRPGGDFSRDAAPRGSVDPFPLGVNAVAGAGRWAVALWEQPGRSEAPGRTYASIGRF